MKYSIDFILYPGMLGLDITGPLEVFNSANRLLEVRGESQNGYSFRFSADEKGAVITSSGLSLIADSCFSEVCKTDMILIPGGEAGRAAEAGAVLSDFLRKKIKTAKRIISVCKGSSILAEAGLLNGRKAATHWMAAAEMSKKYPEVCVDKDAIFVNDGPFYTSAGVSSGIDLALFIVEEDFGRELALDVSRFLVLYYKRPGNQSQFSSTLSLQEKAGSRFDRLYSWLKDNISKNISVDDMADQAGMSPRNFFRVFKRDSGFSPNAYLEMIRLDKARELIAEQDISLEEIAAECGFSREERFRRAFFRNFGITPSQYRIHSPEIGR